MTCLYTRYPIVARARGLAAASSVFRPSACPIKGILHTNFVLKVVIGVGNGLSDGGSLYTRYPIVACVREQRYLAYKANR